MFDKISPNGTVFQINGNLGGTAGIAEMLIQSHNGHFELLPALPKEWSKGYVISLCARGVFVIDMDWKDGSITKAEIYTEKSGRCLVKIGNKQTIGNTEDS